MAGYKLTAAKVRGLAEPGQYLDRDGLYLQIKANRDKTKLRRSWIFRYTRDGKTRWMGLGPVRLVPLAKARDKVLDFRRMLLDGIDPMTAKEAERAEGAKAAKSVVTFRQAAERYVAAHENTWKNPKHRQQWKNTLDSYAYPVFGDWDVKAVDTAAVMEVIESLWTTKPETASRLRGRIETVLGYAKSRHWRTGENPARWREHLENLLPKRSKVRKVKHHAALPWQRIGAFMGVLRKQDSLGARALDFTILTAVRTNETIGAKWSEIDLTGAVWTIPGERMKAEREHRVPLSPSAVALLKTTLPLRDPDAGDFVFPGGKKGKPMSNAAMSAVIDRMNEVEEGQPLPWVDPKQNDRPITVHGFRSSFSDWRAEATAYPEELGEACLAHVTKDKVKAAYQRGDLFERRRRLMKSWTTFCSQPSREGEVTPMRRQG
jgi:integrase